MEQQLDLLSTIPGSRISDPATSRLAEQSNKRSGNQLRHAQVLLRLVRENPGRTSAELSELAIAAGHEDIDRHAAGRRLPELRKLGKVTNPTNHEGKRITRKCMSLQSTAMIWVATEVRAAA